MRLIWRESALADLEQAIGYIAMDSPKNAAEQLDRIERSVLDLGDHPRMGRMGRLAGTRERVVPRTPFVVVYTITENVELIRILHGAQEWPPALDS
ncbi:type II toxin-antitoxin system RelE/ParE family toxin [Labrys neptuniae]